MTRLKVLSFIFTQQETILNNEPYDRLQQDSEEAKRSRQEAENEAIQAIYMVCYKHGFLGLISGLISVLPCSIA